jgi:glycosyltransferase involved in cell wall biosynthesis
MKIVHIVSYYHDKLKYQEFYLTKEQIAQGHEVVILTSERNYPIANYEKVGKPIFGERIMQVGTYTGSHGEKIIRLPVRYETGARTWLKGITATLKAEKPHLIIFHGVVQFHTLSLLFSSFHRQTKVILDEHTVTGDYVGSKPKQYFFKVWSWLFAKKLVKRAHKIIGISNSSIQVLNEYYGMKTEKIQMIPLGVDTTKFKPNAALRITQRAKWDIDPDTFLVLYTGKIVDYKKVHLIFEALAAIKLSVDLPKKLVVVLVGNMSDDYTNTLMTAIEHSKIAHLHIKAVSQDDLPAVFNAADLAVWPAHQTISTIEASACGVPIICSDYLTERYANQNGIGVVPGNLDALKSAIQYLITHDQERMEMGRKGSEMVENEMSWKMVSKKFIEF